MKKLFSIVALLCAAGTQAIWADVAQGGVVYDKVADGVCLVVGWDTNTMPSDGVVTIASTVTVDGVEMPVTGILGGGDYTDYTVKHWGNVQSGDWRGAFCGCKDIKGLRFADDSQVTWIGDHAFKECSNLATASFPDGLVALKQWAFEGTALTSVDLSNTKIDYLYSGAFYNCASLKSITFPSTVKSPADGYVSDYDNQYGKQYLQMSGIERLDLSNTQLVVLADNMCNGCTSLTEVKLPSTLKSTWTSVFYGCTSLSSVVLPNEMNSIGDHTFKDCTSLRSIVLPSSLTNISAWAFENTALTSVVVPSSLATVSEGAFYNCQNLKSATINSNAYLAVNSFGKCTNLTDFYWTSTDENVTTPGYPFADNNPTVHAAPAIVEKLQAMEQMNTSSFDSNFPLTLAHGYATFSSACNLDISGCEGLTAYKGSYDADRDLVVFTPVTKIANYNGVLLKGEEGATYTAKILDAGADVDDFAGNQMYAVVNPVWATGAIDESGNATDFIFYQNAFHPIAAPGYIAAGKAYLFISGGRNCTDTNKAALAMTFEAGGETGIAPVVADGAANTGVYYNLCGQRVEHPQHGVFILNGKKVVVK